MNVTGPDGEHVRDIVRARLGAEVDVGVCGDTPREIRPIACCGHMERDAGRLQLRYVMGGDRHLDHIEVREDDDAVFIYGTVCVPVEDDYGDEMECPYHVYLYRSLGGRPVIDEVGAFAPGMIVFAACSSPAVALRGSRGAPRTSA